MKTDRARRTRLAATLSAAMLGSCVTITAAAQHNRAEPESVQPAPELATLSARLQTLYPSTRFGEIRATPLSGVFEVSMGANLAYVDASGQYFLFGHLYDMRAQRDLTAERKDDCVAASAGFPIASLFWCAGCQGSLYPMNGHVATHIGAVQASTLIAERLTAKMHRQFTTFTGAGSRGLCGLYPLPIMDKTHYKLQMLHPVPATTKHAGQCCQPYGRTTTIWGAGKSWPVTGEDFAYQIFRKRNCCAGAY